MFRKISLTDPTISTDCFPYIREAKKKPLQRAAEVQAQGTWGKRRPEKPLRKIVTLTAED
jgi:hypothetical protein